jgi:predicted outer membrane protein
MVNKTKRIMPLIAAFTLIAATGAFGHNPNGKPDPMNASLEALKGAEFEQSFLQQMIQHHRSALEMAKLVGDHTQRPELRELAEKIITTQQQEIDQMTKWLADWYKTTPKEVANEAADKEMKPHMSMLSGKKDADFDKAFLEMMPKHHHAAVEMAEQAEKKATHPELKEFAAKIAKDQQEEINQMKNWAQSWFGPA